MNKILNSQKIINFLILLGVAITFYFHCYYYHYFSFKPVFVVLTVFILIIIFKIFGKYFLDILSSLPLQNIKFSNFLLILLILSWLIANLFLIFIPLNFSFKNIIFYELNIAQKTTTVFLFYFLFLFLAAAVGCKILKKIFKFNFENWGQWLVFCLGLGLIPFMFYIFGIALVKLLYPITVWLFIVLMVIWSWSELKLIFYKLDKFQIQLLNLNKKNYLQFIIFSGLTILLIFNFIANFKPIPISTDDLSAYFNAPYQYAIHHQYIPFKLFPAASMGQNTEMLYAGIISILSTPYIVHFQFIFFILCLIGFYFLTKEIFGQKYAIFSLATLYLIPWNSYYASITKVEFFAAFYSLLMLFSFWLWLKHKFKPKLIYLLAVFAGISMGIKYNSALLIVPLFLITFLIIIFKTKNKKILLKTYLLSLIIAATFFSPWAIKNYYYFHNILHPFNLFQRNSHSYSPIFPLNSTYTKARKIEINKIRHAVPQNRFSVKGIAETFWNQSVGKHTDRGHWINFGFIPFLILPFFFFYIKDKKILISLSLIVTYFSLWYIIEGVRPWYAFFGFMMIYALLPYLFLKNNKLAWLYIPSVLIITLAYSIVFIVNIAYLIGAENEKSYIQKVIPYYQTAQFINNQQITTKSKILLVGDFRTAFINKNYQILPDQYLNQINYSLNQGPNFFANILRAKGFKYIIYSKMLDYFPVWLTKNNQTVDEYLKTYNSKVPSIYQDIDSLKKFLKNNTELVFSDGFYDLYRLK